jgi:hypothetical protein
MEPKSSVAAGESEGAPVGGLGEVNAVFTDAGAVAATPQQSPSPREARWRLAEAAAVGELIASYVP